MLAGGRWRVFSAIIGTGRPGCNFKRDFNIITSSAQMTDKWHGDVFSWYGECWLRLACPQQQLLLGPSRVHSTGKLWEQSAIHSPTTLAVDTLCMHVSYTSRRGTKDSQPGDGMQSERWFFYKWVVKTGFWVRPMSSSVA